MKTFFKVVLTAIIIGAVCAGLFNAFFWAAGFFFSFLAIVLCILVATAILVVAGFCCAKYIWGDEPIPQAPGADYTES